MIATTHVVGRERPVTRSLHVLDVSLPVIAGYTSRSRNIVLHQRSVGLSPMVVTSPRHPGDGADELIDGVPHFRTVPPPRRPWGRIPLARELGEMNALYRRVLEVAAREHADVIHAHSSILVGIPSFVAARRLGIPFVYEVRALWEDAAVDAGRDAEGSLRYRAVQRAETHLTRNADAVVTICHGLRRELVARGAHPVFVVPNGVDLERFDPKRTIDVPLRESGILVAYVGTFGELEGMPLLVEALVRLIRSGRHDIWGLFVGRGPTYERCRRIATEAGLSERIVHPGLVAPQDVPRLYAAADILAYPRLPRRIAEMVTPLKPLEAMAMGKAVIGARVAGLEELIHDGVTGIMHRAGDVEDLATQIARLADDPQLRARLGQTARAWVVENRDWAKIIRRYPRAYAAAQKRHNRRLTPPAGRAAPARRHTDNELLQEHTP